MVFWLEQKLMSLSGVKRQICCLLVVACLSEYLKQVWGAEPQELLGIK